MYKTRSMAVLLVVGALMFAMVGAVWAVPGWPSSFYGEIHISDNPPQANDVVQAYVPGVSSPVGTATIRTYQGNLVYSIHVCTDDNDMPGKDGGFEGDVISFTIGSRLVMTATFQGGTNVQRNVHPPDPVVTNNGPVGEGTAVTIDAQPSQDWGGDTSTYAFDCNNDGTYEIGPQAGATAQCTFDSTTTHTVNVRLVDGQGGAGADSTTVTVNNVPPIVTFATGNDTTVSEGTTVHTYNYIISDPGHDAITSVVTTCGDHGAKVADSDSHTDTAGSFQCTFPDGPANSTVTAQATDAEGGVGGAATQAVAVSNLPPTHVDAGGPYHGIAGQPVLLHGTATCAPGDICTFAWDLDNNGSYETLGQDVSFTQNTVNIYTVGLRVTDDDGSSANGKTDVNIASQQVMVKMYTTFLPIVIR